ncbi:cadherin domain-containing protein [Pararhizobium sp. O133]|uniref:cadherin domain-containing protein n=1 Tax=Pararhizobium sp. O133 TaxID=3449278 RepID=UPI003F68725E
MANASITTPQGTTITIDDNSFDPQIAAGTVVATVTVSDPDGLWNFFLVPPQINGEDAITLFGWQYDGLSGTAEEGISFDASTSSFTFKIVALSDIDFGDLASYDFGFATAYGPTYDNIEYEEGIVLPVAIEEDVVNTAPTDIELSATSIAENSAIGTVVGLLSAVDADGDAITYTLDTNTGNKFEIVGNELRLKAGVNYEAAASHLIKVIATDSFGNATSQEYTIAIDNVDEAPSTPTLSSPYVPTLQAIAVAENSAAGTLVGNLASTDPEGGVLTYTLLDDADGLFVLDGNKVKLAQQLGDYETAVSKSYEITVQVADANGNTTNKTFTIQHADAFDAPEGTLTIDASGVAGGIDFATFISTYFSGLGNSAFTFYGGTPDIFYGSPQNVSGEQIAFNYKEGGVATTDRVVLEGTDLAYDYIHSGTANGHGISGSLQSLTFGQWVEGVTTGTAGIGDSGLLQGLSEQLKISGFDLTAAVGTGHVAQLNLIYALYSAVQTGNATAIYAAMSNYAQNFTGSTGNDTFTGSAFADVINGGDGNDVLSGGEGDDTINGGDGSDTITGGAGDDIIDGGAGTDTVVFDGTFGGPSSNYGFTVNGDGSITVTDNRSTGGTGADTISNVEILKFSNLTYNLTTHQANYTPTDIALNSTRISETSPIGTAIGVLTTTDAEGGTLTYTLSNDAIGKFAIETVAGITRLVLASSLDYSQATSHSVDVTVTDSAGNSYKETFTVDVQERATINIDASALDGINFDTYFAEYFAEVALNGSSAFHGGTPDGSYGYYNGDQVTFRYRDSGSSNTSAATHVVSIDGEDLSYDSIHLQSQFPNAHGYISGSVNSITFGNVTGTAPASGTELYTAFEQLLKISGFDITTAAGAGGGSSSNNFVSALYYALQKGQVSTLHDLLDRFAQNFTGSDGNDTFTGSKFADTINGGEGNDTLAGGGGNDTIDGGAGTDTVVFDGTFGGPSGNYGFTVNGDGSITVTDNRSTGGTGADTLSNVEILKFNNLTYNLSTHQANYTPTNVALDDAHVAGNATVGEVVGSLQVTDQDSGDTHSFSLIDDAGGLFVLDGSAIKLAGVLDASSYTVRVKVTDGAGNTFEKDLSITVDTPDLAPTNLALSNDDIDENSAVGTVVGTLSATDPEGGAVTYTLAEPSDFFEIVGNEVRVKGAIDFETASSHEIKIIASDAGGNQTQETFTIDVNDIDDAPTEPSKGTITIDVSGSGIAGVDFEAYMRGGFISDTAGGGFPSFDNSGLFAGEEMFIGYGTSATSKYVLARGDLSYNFGTHTIAGEINTIEFGTRGSGSFNGNGAFTGADTTLKITGLDFVNGVPSNPTEEAEIEANGLVHLFGIAHMYGNSTDPATAAKVAAALDKIADGLDAYAQHFIGSAGADIYAGTQYGDEIEGGAGNDLLSGGGGDDTITGGAGNNIISGGFGSDVAVYSDFKSGYTVTDNEDGTFTVLDKAAGTSDTLTGVEFLRFKDVIVDLSDGSEEVVGEPPENIQLSNASVAENAAVGTVIGTLSAVDPDGGTVSFALTGAVSDKFEIVGNELRLKAGVDFETAQSHEITVRVTDTFGSTTDKTFTIGVTDVNEAPVNLALSKATVAENAAVGTVIGTLSAADPEGGSLSYSLGSNPDGKFEIVGNQLRVKAGLDYETVKNHPITVLVKDAAGNTTSKNFTIKVTNIDEAPVSVTLSKATVAENTKVGTTVGMLSAIDPEGGDVVYNLSSNPGGMFKIVDNKLQVAKVLDYETAKGYTIKVEAIDVGGNVTEKTFTIGVSDVNEAPGSVTLSKATVAENTKVGTTIGTLSAVDPEGKALTYTLTDNAGGLFKLDGNKLQLAKAVDYEKLKSDTITVQVKDAAGLTVTKTFTIGITDVNEAPGSVTLSKATVAENTKVGTTIGTLSAVDPEGKALTYTLTDNAGGLFKLDGNKLQLAKAVDYEKLKSDTITVEVKDAGGLTVTKTFTIGITDVNEAPGSVALSKATVAENTKVGTTIGMLSAVDPEGKALTYTLTDNAGGLFKLDGNKLQLAKAVDYEKLKSDTITVQVKDAGGLTVTKTFTIGITDVNEAPGSVALSKATVAENTKVGTTIGMLSAVDPEGKALTYTLTDNAGGLFKLDGNKLQLAKAVDYEKLKSDTITVQVKDAGGLTVTKTFTIGITDVNEAPGSVALSKATVAENTKVGTTIGMLSAVDPEGKALTYTLTDNAGGLFKLDGNKLQLAKAVDYEKLKSDTITVQVKDAGGLKVTKTFTIGITDVNEAPGSVALSKATVAENTKVGTTIGTLSALDPEGKALTYKLLDNAGGLFKLDGNKLQVAKGIDYEKVQSDTIKVEVKDAGGLTVTKTFTIGVTDMLETITGTSASQTLKGGIGADKIVAGAGNDTLIGYAGNDLLYGDAGNDTLYGGLGADDLTGGAGKDTFLFKTLGDSTVSSTGRDTIFDFSGTAGDRIDLSTIDASTKSAGDQAFSFIGAAEFTGKAGELRFYKTSANTYVYGDVNGDAKADFAIHLDDAVTLTKGYFVL